MTSILYDHHGDGHTLIEGQFKPSSRWSPDPYDPHDPSEGDYPYMQAQPTHSLPYTCEQLNNLIETALANTLSTSLLKFETWKKEAFVEDQAAFNVWRTTNARRIVGEFVTALRRELAPLKTAAVSAEHTRLGGYHSVPRSNKEKVSGLWGFIDYITTTTTWHDLIMNARLNSEYSPAGIEEYTTICKLNSQGGVITWTSREGAAYNVKKTAQELNKYMTFHSETKKPSRLEEQVRVSNEKDRHVCPPPVAPPVAPFRAFQATQREPLMPLPSKDLSDDDKLAGYIDHQLVDTGLHTNRLEALLKEVKATNEEASKVSDNLISLAREATQGV